MQAGAGGDGRAVPPEGTRPGRGTWTWRKPEALRDAHLAATQRNETNDRNKKNPAFGVSTFHRRNVGFDSKSSEKPFL